MSQSSVNCNHVLIFVQGESGENGKKESLMVSPFSSSSDERFFGDPPSEVTTWGRADQDVRFSEALAFTVCSALSETMLDREPALMPCNPSSSESKNPREIPIRRREHRRREF
jgi:hypothetical protein